MTHNWGGGEFTFVFNGKPPFQVCDYPCKLHSQPLSILLFDTLYVLFLFFSTFSLPLFLLATFSSYMNLINWLFRKRHRREKTKAQSSTKRSSCIDPTPSALSSSSYNDDHDLLFQCIQAALFPAPAGPTATTRNNNQYRNSASTTVAMLPPPRSQQQQQQRKRWSTGMMLDNACALPPPSSSGTHYLSTIPEAADSPSPPPPPPFLHHSSITLTSISSSSYVRPWWFWKRKIPHARTHPYHNSSTFFVNTSFNSTSNVHTYLLTTWFYIISLLFGNLGEGNPDDQNRFTATNYRCGWIFRVMYLTIAPCV